MKTVFGNSQGESTCARVSRRHLPKKLIFIFTIVVVSAVYSFAATDVLFLIDSTGSMAGLDSFKTALNRILAAVDADSGCSHTIMYGVADYKNYADGGNYETYGVNLVQPFTYSLLEALSAISGLSAGGGVDPPESQLKAMVTITENWRTPAGDLGFNGRANAQKILIWAGDAPGHVAGDEPGADGPPPAGYYPSLDATITALTEQWITVFALNSSGEHAGLDELYAGHHQASEITAATGGILFNSVGSGNQEIEDGIVEAITCVSLDKDDDLDDEDPSDCREPGQELTYTIYYSNDGDETVEDAFILDWLPWNVTYPNGDWTFGFDPNASPPIVLYPPDPGYDAGIHTYAWVLGSIDPNAFGSVQLGVVVNEAAAPGTFLHNVAELWGTIYVRDPNDPNSLVPELRLVGRAVLDTPVCCYITPPQTLFVDETAVNGAQTGVDWANAFLSLQDALAYARAALCGQVEFIYVAQGTYSPGDTEEDSFDLTSLPGISLYGGFKTGGCPFEERDPKRYETILVGRIDETTRNDTIVTMGHETLLDGFTVTESSVLGQGIFGAEADFAVENCTIEKNDGYGIVATDGDVIVRWCNLLDNKADGILHQGADHVLVVENCWVRQSGRFGIACVNSTPVVRNSIVSESDMSEFGNEGIFLFNPTYSPLLQNVTVAHNNAAGLSLMGSNLPDIQNCIVYHNNNGGPQLAGFSADDAAWYSCIQDCNSVNYNINVDPQFAYFDPNNMRIAFSSPCRDTGNPSLSYTEQLEMDRKDRVYGLAVDRGAYEVTCEETSSPWDWNADGIVNFHEFGRFAAVWRAHDPNDPAFIDPNHPDHEYVTEPNSPGYVAPEAMALWYPDGCLYNFSIAGSSLYCIDVADLAAFVEDPPWLWMACWLEQGELLQMGFGEMGMMAFEVQPVEMESVESQMKRLVNVIGPLESLWLTDPDIQQEINAADWQQFMDALYDNLIDLYEGTIQIE